MIRSMTRRGVTLASLVLVLLGGTVVATQSPAAAAGCSGTLIEHLPMYGDQGCPHGSLFAHLDVYYSSTGVNCARVNSYGSYWGYSKRMGVQIEKCRETVPSANCTMIAYDDDPQDGWEVQGGAWYSYYAGPVSVSAPNNCIWAVGIVVIGTSRAVATTTKNGNEARHC